jgi:hypothetical protein
MAALAKVGVGCWVLGVGNEDVVKGWAHLAAGVEAVSLWECLHDAYLVALRSDPAAAAVELELTSPHLREHFGLGSDWRFTLRFTGVGLVRAERWAFVAEGLSAGRLESASWRELEAAVGAECSLDVYDAELAEQGGVALRLCGVLDSETYCALEIVAQALTASRNDGLPFSIEDLMVMGRAYWEAFAARRADRDAAGEDAPTPP